MLVPNAFEFFRGHKFTLIGISVFKLVMTRSWFLVWKVLSMSVITQARRLPLWRSYSLSHRLLQPQGRGGRSATQSCRASFNQDSHSIDRCLQQSSKFQLLLRCLLSEPSVRLKLLGSAGCEAGVTLQRPEPPSVPPWEQEYRLRHASAHLYLLGPHGLGDHNRCQDTLMKT